MKTKVSSKYILCFIMIFPMVIPEGLAILSPTVFNLIFKYGRMLSFAIVILLFYLKAKNGRVVLSIQLIISFVLASYCLVVTYLGGHGVSGWISVFWPCLFAGIIVEYAKSDIDVLINTLLIVLEFWIYVNFLFMLIYPNGMYENINIGYTKNWILGYKSSFQYLMFPAVILGWIQSTYSGSKLRFYVLLLISIIESFLSGNAMLFVALMIISICYLFNVVKFSKLFNPMIYSTIILVVNLLFIFRLTILVNTKLGYIFLDYFGKSTTLGGRASYIWPITIQKIVENPVLGYGVWSSDERRMLYLNKPAAIHAHNQLLEMLFIGGVVFLLLYTLFNFRMYKKAKSSKNCRSTKIVFFGLFLFHCMMAVEIYMRHNSFPVWIIIYLAFITKEIDKKMTNKLNLQMTEMKSLRCRFQIR